MKKLFEKYPMLHYTVVLTAIAIVMGLVIGGINAWTEPIIEENALAAKNAAYREVLPDLDYSIDLLSDEDPSTIDDKVAAYDANDELIGFIFNANKTNGYGEMTVVVAIAADGEILGAQFLVLNQTLHLDRTRSNLALYVGTNITDLTPNGDLQGGATFSKTTMVELLTDIAVSFEASAGDIVVDPIEKLFGAGAISEEDTTFSATDDVISKNVVKDANSDVVGYVYTVEGEDTYIDGESDLGTIQVVVTLDTENNILDIELPSSAYTQSKGTRYASVVEYAESLINSNLSDYSSDADLTSGATNSKTLVRELLVALKGVVIPS